MAVTLSRLAALIGWFVSRAPALAIFLVLLVPHVLRVRCDERA